jgi:hypothetical protein
MLKERLFTQFYMPLEQELQRAGVPEPDALELVGEEEIFWPGYRIHTWERLKAEFALSLKFSRFKQQQGRLSEARSLLWPLTGENFLRNCNGLAQLLQREGYNVTALCADFLENEENQRLMDRIRQAEEACLHPETSFEEADHLLHQEKNLFEMASTLLEQYEA